MGGTWEVAVKDLETLARQYVRERVDKGEVNSESSVRLSSKLLSFTDHANGKFTPGKVDRWLARPGLSPSFRRDRFYALRGFALWCIRKGHIDKDPMVDMKPPRVPKGLPRALPAEDAHQLVAHALDLRERLIVLLMLQEALRRCEVARIQLADVDFRSRRLAVRGKGGTGGPTRFVWLSDETLSTARQYIAALEITSGPLVRNHKSPERGISADYVSHLVLQIFRRAGVKDHIGDGRSAHALRHTALTDMVDNGADLRSVQRVAGHVSIRTTQHYTEGAVADLEAAMTGRTYTERAS